MNRSIEAIILAGGNGSRMADVTNSCQKCLLPIDGKPVLGHIMDTLVSAFGSVDLKIGVAYKSEQVIDYVNKSKPDKIDVTYVPHIPGTEGWGAYHTMEKHVRGTFIAMPGDIIALPEAYSQAVEVFEGKNVCGAMTLSSDVDVVDTHGVGVIEEGKVVDLQWPPPTKIQEGYSRDMTIWSSDKRFFGILNEYPSPKKSIGIVFTRAIKDSIPIAGNLYEGKWIHLGYPEDLKKSLKREMVI